MSRLEQWKRRLTAREDKVKVNVGGEVAELTRTQAYRFDQLAQTWEVEQIDENPFAKERYTLEEAAVELMQSEAAILADVAHGHRLAYVNAAGLSGRWRRALPDGGAEHSGETELTTGYLALPPVVAAQLAESGETHASVLEFRLPAREQAAEFEPQQLARIGSWGDGQKYFCLSAPLRIVPRAVVLMAPLIQRD